MKCASECLNPVYFCLCQNVKICKNHLVDHLKQPHHHKIIQKKSNEKSESKASNKALILKRIENLRKIIDKISSVSINLKNTIINQSKILILQLESMILYYKSLEDYPEIPQTIKKDLLKNKLKFPYDQRIELKIRENFSQDNFVMVRNYAYKKKELNKNFNKIVKNLNFDSQILEVSNNKKFILSTCYDQTIRLWCNETFEVKKIFSGHKKLISCLRISSDDTQILSGSLDTTLRLWDIKKGVQVLKFTGHNGYIKDAVFSPNNELACSISDDITLKTWNLRKNCILNSFNLVLLPVKIIKFNSDNSVLYCICTGVINFINFQDENVKETEIFKINTLIKNLCVSKNEKLLAVAFGGIEIWNFEELERLTVLQTSGVAGNNLEFSDDSKFLAFSSYTSEIFIWKLENFSLIYKFSTGSRECPIKFLDSNTLLYSNLENINAIKLSDEEIVQTNYLKKKNFIVNLTVSNTNKYICSVGSCVQLFCLYNAKKIFTYNESHTTTGIQFNADDSFVVGGFKDNTIIIFKVPSLEVVKTLTISFYSRIVSLSLNCDLIAVSDFNSKFEILSVQSNERKAFYSNVKVTSMLFSRYHEKLFVSEGIYLRIFDSNAHLDSSIIINLSAVRLFAIPKREYIIAHKLDGVFGVVDLNTMTVCLLTYKRKQIKELLFKDEKSEFLNYSTCNWISNFF